MKSFAFWIAILSALLFGAATPISKPLLDHLTSFQLAGLLYLGAAIGVLVLVLKGGKLLLPWKMDGKNRMRLIGAVFFGGLVAPLALLAGLRLASAASVSMWLNLEMVATAILGHFIFKDHLTRKSWFAAAGVFLAALILAVGEGMAAFQAGALVALACVCWGLDNHLTALIDGISPAQSTFWKGLVAGSTNLLIGVLIVPLTAPVWVTLSGVLIGVFAYGLSIVLYITSAQQIGATRSQLIFSSSPFWGLLLSVFILKEAITWQIVIALIILIFSIFVLFQEQHSHPHEHENRQHDHLHSHNDGHHTHLHGEYPVSGWHMHEHLHEAFNHSHPHWPDIHHRHTHSKES
ncbi:MAG: DMT family transporter [Anaerolineaceae bacterium]